MAANSTNLFLTDPPFYSNKSECVPARMRQSSLPYILSKSGENNRPLVNNAGFIVRGRKIKILSVEKYFT